ncbi:acyltransferase family protein [Leptospira interrogans]
MFRYRADIDGLRAIAVLVVLIFHAGLGPVSGGFVGVDVFFVISGYLITSIIVSEASRGEFSFADFYERRIRRIIPALMTVIATSAVIGWYVLVPADYVNFARSAIAAAAFYSNFFFNDQAEDYFAPSADLQPLLHTWSLGVEEQFYLIAPFFILLLLGRLQRFRGWLVGGVFVMSLAISVYSVQAGWPSAFYLLPSRAFELTIGMVLALGLIPGIANKGLRQIAGLCGLGLITAAALLFTDDTPFPGIAALVPCLGAALLIHSGGHADTWVCRILATRPMVFVGKISYSLYLWHWPLLAYARYTAVDPLTTQERVGLLWLAFVLSVVTYYCIEQPVRQRKVFATRRQVFSGGGVALVSCLAVTIGIVATRGFPIRLAPNVAEFARLIPAKYATASQCLKESSNGTCAIGDTNDVPPSFMLWGDSHARMLSKAIEEAATHRGLAGFVNTHSGCMPLRDLAEVQPGRFRWCFAASDEARKLVGVGSLEHTILAGRWIGFIAKRKSNTEHVRLGPLVAQDFGRELRETVEMLREGGRAVTIVGPVPELRFNLPMAITRAMMRGEVEDFSIPRRVFDAEQAPILEALSALDAMPRVRVLYPHLVLCNEVRCRTVEDGLPLYVDDDHLSPTGVKIIAGLLDDALGASSLKQEVVGRIEQRLH